MFTHSTQGDSGDATDDEMVSRKTRSCKEGLYRNGPESDSIDQEDPGDILRSYLNSNKELKICRGMPSEVVTQKNTQNLI